MRIEQIELQVGQARPMRLPVRLEIGDGQRTIGDVDGGLGDAVHVDQTRLRVAVAGEPGAQRIEVERFAAEDHVAQRQRRRGRRVLLGLHQLTKGRRRLVEHGDALALPADRGTRPASGSPRGGTITRHPPWSSAPHSSHTEKSNAHE